jgi:hypothetical protein
MPSLILSDNGVSSGSAGLKTTAASDGSLALQTSTAGGAATTAVTIDTSQNVGIGTGSPSSLAANYTTVDIRGATGGALRFGNATDSSYIYSDSNETNIATATNKRMIFSINTAEKMRLDTSGNLGLGVTPSAWGSSSRAFQVSGSSLSRNDNVDARLSLSNNIYRDSADQWRYMASFAGTLYQQFFTEGAHAWFNAPVGTAGNLVTLTQAMTLDSGGNLLVGATASSFKILANVQSGANRDVFSAQIEGASNGFQIKWNHATSTTRVNISNLPTSASGLASGDLYVLAGALMVA